MRCLKILYKNTLLILKINYKDKKVRERMFENNSEIIPKNIEDLSGYEKIISRQIAKVLTMLENDGANLTREDKKVIKNGMRHLAEDIINSKGMENDYKFNR